jgi:hypothetical protein
MMKNLRAAALLTLMTTPLPALASPIHAVLYRNPQCSCCDAYAAILKDNGFDVDLKAADNVSQISKMAGVPADLEGCHTMRIGDYVFEGLVPIDIVKKVLAEHPAIAGVSLAGMMTGAPGMPGVKTAPFKIYAFTRDGKAPTVYATE